MMRSATFIGVSLRQRNTAAGETVLRVKVEWLACIKRGQLGMVISYNHG